jgi:hypothetical protein
MSKKPVMPDAAEFRRRMAHNASLGATEILFTPVQALDGVQLEMYAIEPLSDQQRGILEPTWVKASEDAQKLWKATQHPAKAAEAASDKRHREQAEKLQILCDIIDNPDNASLGWIDLMDLAPFESSKRLESRMLRYRNARKLGAAPETALWASERGNWRHFKDVLKSRPR